MKRCLGCEATFEGASWTCPKCGWGPDTNSEFARFAPALDGQSEGFEAHYFEPLARLEEGSFWFRSRNRLIASTIRRLFPSSRDFLEIGCGTGYVMTHLQSEFPELRVTGLELFSAALGFASSRVPSATLMQVDARHLPFESEFDLVGAFDVIEHVAEDDAVLREIHRALKPGGMILVTVPQHQWLWSAADEYAHHQRRYRRSTAREKLEGAGFEVVLATSFVFALMPLMVIARIRNRNLDDSYDPHAEFGLAPAVDRMFEMVMTAERTVIEKGVSLPAGGSLLIVGRREP